jgi:two-component sensor histidine kinase
MASGPRIASAVALVTFDDRGEIIESNAALQALLQRPAQELAGKPLARFMSPAGRVVFENHLVPLLHLNGQVHELALQLRTAQGGNVYVMCSAARIEVDGGVRNECAFMRMSERKRVEDELLRLKRTTEQLPGALFQLLRHADGSMQLPIATTAVRTLFGVQAREPQVAAEELLGCVVAEDAPALRQGLQASAQAMAPWCSEFRIRLGGQLAWRALEARPQSLSNGAVLWHGYASDITARKAAQAQLAEALQIKEMLLREVNHRVKNNLQVISSMLSLQLRSLRDPGARQAVAAAQARVAVVAQLHQQLYSTGTHVAVDFAVHARKLAVDTLASLGANLRIGLDYQCPGPLPMAMDEAVPLSLVMSELLTNAVKHAFAPDQRGTMQLHVELSGDSLSVRVADDGAGLPANFDPAGAAGLGMRIVQALMLQLDARLQVLPLHRGAAFLITMKHCSRQAAPMDQAAAY